MQFLVMHDKYALENLMNNLKGIIRRRNMKINIELDCSPEEFKELFIPSDKQTEFTTEFYNAMQKSFVKQYLDMGKNFMNQFEEKAK